MFFFDFVRSLWYSSRKLIHNTNYKVIMKKVIMKTPFYGRTDELDRLRFLLRKQSASLVIIKGRRRIGKSRLIQEFSEDFKTVFFIGLPPEKETTAQDQRDYFAEQIKINLSIDHIDTADWTSLLWTLAHQVKEGRTIIVLDEINWIGSLDHTFLGKLKSAWDLHFKRNPQLLLILSGSMSAWIDKNILSSTGFMGRNSLELTLDELSLPVCNLFWGKKAKLVSAYEKFKILSVTGGVPRYLEEIDPNKSAEENIFYLAFRRGGLLLEEFGRIFSDLFLKRSPRYKQIVERLADGSASLEQIAIAVRMEKGGTLSEYLDDLVETGYVAKDFAWNFNTGKRSAIFRYRLKDNYLRFYLKFIAPYKEQIEKNQVRTLPQWSTIMGLQFENLVDANFHALFSLLGINSDEIIYDSPYFQRATINQPGCQIDYLIQSKYKTLYVCEIKFSKKEIGASIISGVKQKIKRLPKASKFSIRPVLIHVNGVTDELREADFFAHIIDFGQMLNARRS